MWETRLVAYPPGGDTRLGWLLAPLSWQASFPHNDVGALSLTYSSVTAGGPLLSQALESGLDVALEVNWGAGWVEPDGGRYCLIGRQQNPADPNKALTLTLPSYGWQAGKVRNLALELLETDGDFAGQRLYDTASAGAIMRSQLDEWAGRHPSTPHALTWGFTADLDSAGTAWTDKRTIPYEVGATAKDILAGLASMRMCDWRTRKRQLLLYKTDTQTTDLHATVSLQLRRDISDAPSTESLEDVAGYTLVTGEQGVVTTVTAAAPSAWGVWEGYLTASGATTEAEAQQAVANDIEKRARAAGEYTRQLLIADTTKHLPFRDYGPGDIITAPATTAKAAMRVQQITLTGGTDGPGGSVVLNDRLVPADLRTARKVSALLSGANPSGTGVGVGSSDQRTPAAPMGLTLGEQRYQDAVGVWRSAIGATWLPVTSSTGATEMQIASYSLWGRPSGGQWRELTGTTATQVAWQPFETGSVWDFAVTATGVNGRTSALSGTVGWTFGNDTTPPNKPATPSVGPWLGVLVVSWTGKDSSGNPQPSDWHHTEVHYSATPGFTPSSSTLAVSYTTAGGQVSITGVTYGTTYYIKLVSVDWSGNRSTASTEVSGVPVRATASDMDAAYTALITGAQATADAKSRNFRSTPTTPYALGDTWTDAGVVRVCTTARATGSYNAADWTISAQTVDQTARDSANRAADTFTAQPVPPYKLGDLWRDSNSILWICTTARATGTFNSADWSLQTVTAEMLAAQIILATTKFIAGTPTGARVELGPTGLKGYDSGGTLKTTIGTDGKLTATDATFAGTVSGSTVTGSAVSGGTVDGTVITGGTIRTAASGQRVVLNSSTNGLDFYTNSGTLAGSLYGYATGIANLNPIRISGTGLWSDGGIQTAQIYNNGGTITIEPSAELFLDPLNGVRILGVGTSSSAANCYLWLDANGRRLIVLSSSLRAIKAHIEDLPVTPEQVLALQPRHWFDKAEMRNADLDPETATVEDCEAAGLRRTPGFVAEEVEQTAPIFATYDRDEDGTQKLSGIAYDRLAAGLLIVAQQQAATIASLESRLAALEAKIGA